jgi:glutathione peroxidase
VTTAYGFTARTIDGDEQQLSAYQGKVLLIVNTASECGYTPQYEGLQELWERYADRGLVVLGFPCDQFGHQEPGDEAQIKAFCTETYHVSFPMFAKVDVNGASAHPLFAWLTLGSGPAAGEVEWNFTKFLVDTDGAIVGRYGPDVEPEKLTDDIERLLPT